MELFSAPINANIHLQHDDALIAVLKNICTKCLVPFKYSQHSQLANSLNTEQQIVTPQLQSKQEELKRLFLTKRACRRITFNERTLDKTTSLSASEALTQGEMVVYQSKGSVVRSNPPAVNMSKWPRARYFTPNCSMSTVLKTWCI